jgi:Fe2+ or Zn2+ uptake regulation protein
MTDILSDEPLEKLTESQRQVLDLFEYSWDVLTINAIRKSTKEKLSTKTIRRALKKLSDMGLLVRQPAEKLGRGYSNLYKLAEE